MYRNDLSIGYLNHFKNKGIIHISLIQENENFAKHLN